MKRSVLALFICFVCLVFLLCRYSDFVIKSFADGLQLWYNGLVPVLLPFLLLSGTFLSRLNLDHPNKIVCLLLLFLCGLFCGYPVGAIAIWNMYERGVINKRFACSVLPLTNNVSPMFFVGYVYHPYLEAYVSFFPCLCMIYLPQIVYALCCNLLPSASRCARAAAAVGGSAYSKELAASGADTTVILDSVRTITIIGIYISVFSVLFDTVTKLFPSSLFLSSAACFLEITKGIPMLATLSLSTAKKTALFLSLTAFGGVSSLFQSMHILKNTDLSFCHYLFGKTVCAIMTFACAYFVLL